MIGAGLFLVIQLILLVFMVHGWADSVVRRVNSGASPCFWYGGWYSISYNKIIICMDLKI